MLDRELLPETKIVRSIGVNIDKNLNFSFHLSEIVKNVSTQLYVYSTMRQFVTRVFLITHYKTYKEPNIIFYL